MAFCDGCFHKACCCIFNVDLKESEIGTGIYLTIPDGTHLQRTKSGDCVYLIDGQCSIYATRPITCQNWRCDEDSRFPELVDSWLTGRKWFVDTDSPYYGNGDTKDDL